MINTDLGSFDENAMIKLPLHIALTAVEIHRDYVAYLEEVLSDKNTLDEYCEAENLTYMDVATDLDIAIIEMQEIEGFLRLHSLEKMN
jgi:hypothetical protein